MDVSWWLRQLGLERYAEAFGRHDIDADCLATLTSVDLVNIGVHSVGHRRRLLEAIAALEEAQPLQARPAGAAPPEAEHRQLTVLYCAMGNPGAPPSDLPTEEMRAVIRSFHQTCTRVMAEFDGHVANFFGDCVLAYFGWPRAHEDDAERAVRAGLTLARCMVMVHRGSGPGREALSLRVGIATGAVVVGELTREGPAREQSAVGLTPNLGARILSLAAPGQVAIDELTRQLLAPSFVVEWLGRHALKGIAEPVDAYVVGAERAAESRFEARKGRDLTPMVGRDRELALLLERWSLAKGGEGQAVLLVGEAGIGKSRLVRALLDACAAGPCERLLRQCSPFHTGSALWPVIQALSRSAGLLATDPTDAALDKLEALVSRGREDMALYATLMGLDGSRRYGPLDMTPQMLRERTLELLARHLFDFAEQRPVLLVFEDTQWIDPTTLELIERALEKIDSARMLVLITSRPDKPPSLATIPSITHLSLNRLGRSSVEAIIARLGGNRLQMKTQATIAAQSDGVPLFVEELTKAVLETGEAAIPASLRGSLMARLDRIADVKEVAQIASCIGRQFEPAQLAIVADRPLEEMSMAVERLVAAGLVLRLRAGPYPTYTFKHALLQDAAYESLLRGRRQQIHACILAALEKDPAGSPPDLLAHHAARAGLSRKAVDYWQRAGEAALSKSAYREAAGHFGKAFALIEERSEGGGMRATLAMSGAHDDRDRARIELQSGTLLTYLARYQEAETRLHAALALAVRANDEHLQATVAEALGSQAWGRGDAAGARLWLDRALATWQSLGAVREEGRAMLTIASTWLPEYARVRDCAERSIDLARRCGDQPTQILANAELGHALRQLGMRSEGEALLEDADATSRRCGDKPLLTSVLNRRAQAACAAGEFAAAKSCFEEAQSLAPSGHASAPARAAIGALRHLDFVLARARGEDIVLLDDVMNDPLRDCRLLIARGYAALCDDDLDAAAASLERARLIVGAYDLPVMQAEVLDDLGLVELKRGNLNQAGTSMRESLVLRRRTGCAMQLMYSLTSMASLLAQTGRTLDAAALAGAAQQACAANGLAVDAFTRGLASDALALARRALPPSEVDGASSQGARMSIDEAVALALGA